MYHGKDDTEWRSTPSAPNTQATVENVNTESSAQLYSIPNAQGVRKNSDLFFSQDIIKLMIEKYTVKRAKG